MHNAAQDDSSISSLLPIIPPTCLFGITDNIIHFIERREYIIRDYANNRAIRVSANRLRVVVYRYTTEHRQQMCCLLPEIDGLQAPMGCTTRTYRVDIITRAILTRSTIERAEYECLLTGLGFVSTVTVYRVIRPPYTVRV